MPVEYAAKKVVSMEALFDRHANQQMISEANAFKTVSKGLYRLRATKYEASEGADGRVTIWFSVDILGPEGTRKAKGSMKISSDERRTAKGYLDTQCKMHGQLLKALYPDASDRERADISDAELIQVFMQTPVDGFIALTFKGPKDPVTGWHTWNDPANDEEEAQFRASGYTPTNIIRSVQKAAN